MIERKSCNTDIITNWQLIHGKTSLIFLWGRTNSNQSAISQSSLIQEMRQIKIRHLFWVSSSLTFRPTTECGFTLKRIHDMIRTYSQMHRTENTKSQANMKKSFLGQIWSKKLKVQQKFSQSSPNWLKFGAAVHCYIFISNLMFIFPKILLLTFLG